jgi:hypothetical protein
LRRPEYTVSTFTLKGSDRRRPRCGLQDVICLLVSRRWRCGTPPQDLGYELRKAETAEVVPSDPSFKVREVVVSARKIWGRFGSQGQIRTSNPSVNRFDFKSISCYSAVAWGFSGSQSSPGTVLKLFQARPIDSRTYEMEDQMASPESKPKELPRTLSSLNRLNFSSQVTTGIFSQTTWAMI